MARFGGHEDSIEMELVLLGLSMKRGLLLAIPQPVYSSLPAFHYSLIKDSRLAFIFHTEIKPSKDYAY